MPTDTLARNNVRVTGSGTRPILFAHGFGCDQNMWRFVAPEFEADHRVVLFDYVGAGRSRRSAYDPDRYGSLAGYAADVLDVVDALDLSDVVFVGHSVSSMIGVLAANERPDPFGELVLIGPSPSYLNENGYRGGFERHEIEGLLDMMDRNYIGWANFLAPTIMGNDDRPELGRELTDSFCSTDPMIARRFAEVTFLSDNRSDLEHVRVPTLVLQSAVDAIAPPHVGQYVAERIPGAVYRVIDTVGHCPHMSHPDATVAAVREYLARGAS
jgi:sigma-B regulation protein RsbQ